MSVSPIEYFLWLAAPIMQLCVLRAMQKQKLREQFPIFFLYTAFQIANVAVLFTVHRFSSPETYFYAYWSFSAVGIFLGFAVLYEVFQYLVRPYAGLKGLALLMFRWAALLLVLVSVLLAFSSPGAQIERVIKEIVLLERSIRLVQCGMLLFVVMFSSYLGLSWRHFAFGITVGFGVFAATDLTLFNARAQLGAEWGRALSLTGSVIYNLCVMSWLGYALLPQTVQQREPRYQPTLDRWNQAALAVVHSHSGDVSFASLTEIERAVEQAMEKNKKV